MAKKEKSPTLVRYKRWKLAGFGLKVGSYAAPLIPATVMTIINWDEWFAEAGVSLPLGFASLLVSTLLSIIGMWKKDELLNKKVSAVFYLAILFCCFGATFLFLASLFSQVGFMFLATAGGLVVGGTADQFNKSLIEDRIAEYAKLVEDNVLDDKAKKKAQRKAQAKQDAEREEKERQAVE